nr:hypothetical protein [Tanacetum cinerariifolium]
IHESGAPSAKNFNEKNDDDYRVNIMKNIFNCKYLEMAKLKHFISWNGANSKS